MQNCGAVLVVVVWWYDYIIMIIVIVIAMTIIIVMLIILLVIILIIVILHCGAELWCRIVGRIVGNECNNARRSHICCFVLPFFACRRACRHCSYNSS